MMRRSMVAFRGLVLFGVNMILKEIQVVNAEKKWLIKAEMKCHVKHFFRALFCFFVNNKLWDGHGSKWVFQWCIELHQFNLLSQCLASPFCQILTLLKPSCTSLLKCKWNRLIASHLNDWPNRPNLQCDEIILWANNTEVHNPCGCCTRNCCPSSHCVALCLSWAKRLCPLMKH